jgi:hypothetical protein
MPEIQAGATLDWRGYHGREVDLQPFIPEEEPSEQDRVRFVFRLLGDLRPARILDVGCADGFLCKRYAEAGMSGRLDAHLQTFTMSRSTSLCHQAGLRVVRTARQQVAAAWERPGPFRLLGEQERRVLRCALTCAGPLGEPRAKYIGVLGLKPGATTGV